MNAVTAQLVVVFGVLCSFFIGPAFAYFFLSHRKRQVRKLKRTPIGINLLRPAGHTLHEQLEAARSDMLSDLTLLMFIPTLLLAVYLAQSHIQGLAYMTRLAPVYLMLGLGFVAYTIRKLLRAGARLDNLKTGCDAEMAVGQELDQLMRQGAVTFHDFPADNFNIDHVVIAAEGVFAVETKGIAKLKQSRGKVDATVVYDGQSLKFPTWTTKEPLEQAERQAAWLGKWLTSAVGAPVDVLPVLALPGWFVERPGRGAVRVFSGRALSALLKTGVGQVLSPQDVQRIAHQVEQRCRTLAPLGAEDKKLT